MTKKNNLGPINFLVANTSLCWQPKIKKGLFFIKTLKSKKMWGTDCLQTQNQTLVYTSLQRASIGATSRTHKKNSSQKEKNITKKGSFEICLLARYQYSLIVSKTCKKKRILSYSSLANSSLSTFFNFTFDKGRLKNIVAWTLENYGQYKTVELLEQLKKTGFEYATKAGISLGIDDLKIPPKKKLLLLEAEKLTKLTVHQYQRADITAVERFQRLIETWHRTSEQLKQEVISYFEETDILNPVYMMAFSGARGNISQVRQLVGMRGLMSDPQGQIIDFPIRSNFREGLTLTEYIISSYGARKGIVDTALRTANAGYLTRRLVDVAQHVIISHYDCGTKKGIFLTDMKEGTKTIVSAQTRITGRVLARDIYKPNTNIKIAKRNDEISTDLAFEITKITNKIFVRSSLTCNTTKLLCQLCYGWSLAQGNLVSIGEAVGVIAAQSIGEPGTQLTMRTFHTGGVFAGDVSDEIRAPYNGYAHYASTIPGILIRALDGKILFLTKSDGTLIFSKLYKQNTKEAFIKKYKIPAYTILFVRNGESITQKQVIAQITSIQTKSNTRETAKLVINAELEGLFYAKNLQIQKNIIGPKPKEKTNTHKTRNTKSPETTDFIAVQAMEIVVKARGWNFAWVLSGKRYEMPFLLKTFPSVGDFITPQTVLTRHNFKLPTKYNLVLPQKNLLKKKANINCFGSSTRTMPPRGIDAFQASRYSIHGGSSIQRIEYLDGLKPIYGEAMARDARSSTLTMPPRGIDAFQASSQLFYLAIHGGSSWSGCEQGNRLHQNIKKVLKVYYLKNNICFFDKHQIKAQNINNKILLGHKILLKGGPLGNKLKQQKKLNKTKFLKFLITYKKYFSKTQKKLAKKTRLTRSIKTKLFLKLGPFLNNKPIKSYRQKGEILGQKKRVTLANLFFWANKKTKKKTSASSQYLQSNNKWLYILSSKLPPCYQNNQNNKAVFADAASRATTTNRPINRLEGIKKSKIKEEAPWLRHRWALAHRKDLKAIKQIKIKQDLLLLYLEKIKYYKIGYFGQFSQKIKLGTVHPDKSLLKNRENPALAVYKYPIRLSSFPIVSTSCSSLWSQFIAMAKPWNINKYLSSKKAVFNNPKQQLVFGVAQNNNKGRAIDSRGCGQGPACSHSKSISKAIDFISKRKRPAVYKTNSIYHPLASFVNFRQKNHFAMPQRGIDAFQASKDFNWAYLYTGQPFFSTKVSLTNLEMLQAGAKDKFTDNLLFSPYSLKRFSTFKNSISLKRFKTFNALMLFKQTKSLLTDSILPFSLDTPLKTKQIGKSLGTRESYNNLFFDKKLKKTPEQYLYAMPPRGIDAFQASTSENYQILSLEKTLKIYKNAYKKYNIMTITPACAASKDPRRLLSIRLNKKKPKINKTYNTKLDYKNIQTSSNKLNTKSFNWKKTQHVLLKSGAKAFFNHGLVYNNVNTLQNLLFQIWFKLEKDFPQRERLNQKYPPKNLIEWSTMPTKLAFGYLAKDARSLDTFVDAASRPNKLDNTTNYPTKKIVGTFLKNKSGPNARFSLLTKQNYKQENWVEITKKKIDFYLMNLSNRSINFNLKFTKIPNKSKLSQTFLFKNSNFSFFDSALSLSIKSKQNHDKFIYNRCPLEWLQAGDKTQEINNVRLPNTTKKIKSNNIINKQFIFEYVCVPYKKSPPFISLPNSLIDQSLYEQSILPKKTNRSNKFGPNLLHQIKKTGSSKQQLSLPFAMPQRGIDAFQASKKRNLPKGGQTNLTHAYSNKKTKTIFKHFKKVSKINKKQCLKKISVGQVQQATNRARLLTIKPLPKHLMGQRISDQKDPFATNFNWIQTNAHLLFLFNIYYKNIEKTKKSFLNNLLKKIKTKKIKTKTTKLTYKLKSYHLAYFLSYYSLAFVDTASKAKTTLDKNLNSLLIFFKTGLKKKGRQDLFLNIGQFALLTGIQKNVIFSNNIITNIINLPKTNAGKLNDLAEDFSKYLDKQSLEMLQAGQNLGQKNKNKKYLQFAYIQLSSETNTFLKSFYPQKFKLENLKTINHVINHGHRCPKILIDFSKNIKTGSNKKELPAIYLKSWVYKYPACAASINCLNFTINFCLFNKNNFMLKKLINQKKAKENNRLFNKNKVKICKIVGIFNNLNNLKKNKISLSEPPNIIHTKSPLNKKLKWIINKKPRFLNVPNNVTWEGSPQKIKEALSFMGQLKTGLNGQVLKKKLKSFYSLKKVIYKISPHNILILKNTKEYKHKKSNPCLIRLRFGPTFGKLLKKSNNKKSLTSYFVQKYVLNKQQKDLNLLAKKEKNKIKFNKAFLHTNKKLADAVSNNPLPFGQAVPKQIKQGLPVEIGGILKNKKLIKITKLPFFDFSKNAFNSSFNKTQFAKTILNKKANLSMPKRHLCNKPYAWFWKQHVFKIPQQPCFNYSFTKIFNWGQSIEINKKPASPRQIKKRDSVSMPERHLCNKPYTWQKSRRVKTSLFFLNGLPPIRNVGYNLTQKLGGKKNNRETTKAVILKSINQDFVLQTNTFSPFEGELLSTKYSTKQQNDLNPYPNIKKGLINLNSLEKKPNLMNGALFKHYLKNLNILEKKATFNLFLTKKDFLSLNTNNYYTNKFFILNLKKIFQPFIKKTIKTWDLALYNKENLFNNGLNYNLKNFWLKQNFNKNLQLKKTYKIKIYFPNFKENIITWDSIWSRPCLSNSCFGSMGFSPSMALLAASKKSTLTMPPRGIDAFQASRYSILGGSLDTAQAGQYININKLALKNKNALVKDLRLIQLLTFPYKEKSPLKWLNYKEKDFFIKNKISFFFLKGNTFFNLKNKHQTLFLNKKIYNLNHLLHINKTSLNIKPIFDKELFKNTPSKKQYNKGLIESLLLTNNFLKYYITLKKNQRTHPVITNKLIKYIVPFNHNFINRVYKYPHTPLGHINLRVNKNLCESIEINKKAAFGDAARRDLLTASPKVSKYPIIIFGKISPMNKAVYQTEESLVPAYFLSSYQDILLYKKQKTVINYVSLKVLTKEYFKSFNNIIKEFSSMLLFSFKQGSIQKNNFIVSYPHYIKKVPYLLSQKNKKEVNILQIFVIKKSGQLIHMNNQKITLRIGQPIVISPRSIIHGSHGDFIRYKTAVVTLTYQQLKTGDIVQGIPKIEQLFESRTTKRGRLFRENVTNLLTGLFLKYFVKSTYLLGTINLLLNKKSKYTPKNAKIKRVYYGGQNQTPNNILWLALALQWSVKQSFYKIQQIIVDGILRVYRSQGVTIADKHVEIIVKQMTSKVRIINSNASKLTDYMFSLQNINQWSPSPVKLPDGNSSLKITESLTNNKNSFDTVSLKNIKVTPIKDNTHLTKKQNSRILEKLLSNNLDGPTGLFPGEIVDLDFVENINNYLLKTNIKNNEKSQTSLVIEPIKYEPIVLGITQSSLLVESFLSAASFQQTTRVLSQAALYKKKDFLKGLKENIIIGNLIPAGTGYLSSINF